MITDMFFLAFLNDCLLILLQQSHFKNDDFFKKISRESEVRYTGHKDLKHEERVKLFHRECHSGEDLDIAILSTGTSVKLSVSTIMSNVYAKQRFTLSYLAKFVKF